MKKSQSKKHKSLVKAEWKETIIPDNYPPKCNHYFEFVSGTTVKCKYCPVGLVGVYELKDGRPVI